jgi:hypothetical protein
MSRHLLKADGNPKTPALWPGKLFRLGEKNKTGFIMTHLIVKNAGFRVAIAVGFYD